MKKKLLSLLLALALCVSLAPTAFAAPLTVTFDGCTVTFSDARVVENVPFLSSSGVFYDTVKLYYAAPNSTISVRNDGDTTVKIDENGMDEDGEDWFASYVADQDVYLCPGTWQTYCWLHQGAIVGEEGSNGSFPVRSGDTYTEPAERWVNALSYTEWDSPNVLGIRFDMSGSNAYERLSEIYIALDSEQAVSFTGFQPIRFSDVPSGHWAYSYVQTCAFRGIASGVGDGSFSPDSQVTYAQFAVMAVNAFCPELLDQTAGGAWYTPYMSAARKAGLLAGTAAASSDASANSPMNRYDLAMAAANALSLTGQTASQYSKDAARLRISDWDSVPSACNDAVLTCYAFGILSGFSDNTFGGLQTMTRAQAAVVLAKLDLLLHRNSETLAESIASLS